MVAFKIVEEYPEMVRAMVVSGFESSEDLLLPTSVKGLKTPFALAVHKSMWFPNRLFKDYLKVHTKSCKIISLRQRNYDF
ncbi:hypothetical protein Bca4012_041829 [Brassica carinata]